MARAPKYAIGDQIILKDGFVRTETAGRTCMIAGVLPFDGSRAQYRVRFLTENFERRIVESDIDTALSASPAARDGTAEIVETGSWLKSSSIRVKK